MSPILTDAQAVEFYIHGFRKSLRRYRTLVLAGWGGVVLGAVGLVGSATGFERGDLLVVLTPLITMTAGILVVQQSITGLEAYVTTPYPLPEDDELSEPVRLAVGQAILLMQEVEQGGWQEAFTAMSKIEELEEAVKT